MSTLTLGIVVFLLVSVTITSFMVTAMLRDRANGQPPTLSRLMPYIVADAAWIVIFFVWLRRTI